MVNLSHFNLIFLLFSWFLNNGIFLYEFRIKVHIDNFLIFVYSWIYSESDRQFFLKNLLKKYKFFFSHYLFKYFTIIFVKFWWISAIFSQFIYIIISYVLITVLLILLIFDSLFFLFSFILPNLFMRRSTIITLLSFLPTFIVFVLPIVAFHFIYKTLSNI